MKNVKYSKHQASLTKSGLPRREKNENEKLPICVRMMCSIGSVFNKLHCLAYIHKIILMLLPITCNYNYPKILQTKLTILTNLATLTWHLSRMSMGYFFFSHWLMQVNFSFLEVPVRTSIDCYRSSTIVLVERVTIPNL